MTRLILNNSFEHICQSGLGPYDRRKRAFPVDSIFRKIRRTRTSVYKRSCWLSPASAESYAAANSSAESSLACKSKRERDERRKRGLDLIKFIRICSIERNKYLPPSPDYNNDTSPRRGRAANVQIEREIVTRALCLLRSAYREFVITSGRSRTRRHPITRHRKKVSRNAKRRSTHCRTSAVVRPVTSRPLYDCSYCSVHVAR